MAEMAGKLGALYYSTATLRDTTISFNATSDRVSDSKSRFVSSGFENGDKIVISGSAGGTNDGTFTVDEIAAGYLGISGGFTDETAGNEVTIVTAPDDAQLLGFSNWSLDQKVDTEDITTFENGIADGYKRYAAILNDWTGSADRFWLTTAFYDSFLGLQKWVRFFVQWVAIPAATSEATRAYYYEGMCKITGVSVNEPVGAVVKSTITFQGDGALTLVTRTTAWDV